MTFLNATLLLGMTAAAVPLALHLLARREPKRAVFPAVRFLTQRFETNRSKMRLRRWWLLALRIAAVLAMAFVLARPMIHPSLSVPWLSAGLLGLLGVGLLVLASLALLRTPSKSTAYGLAAGGVLAILGALFWSGYTAASGPAPEIDQTAPVAIALVLDNSPTAAWQDGDDDRISRIRQIADWVISRLPATSRIAVIDRSAKPATFSLDAGGARSTVEQLQPRQVVQPIQQRIAAGIRLVRTSELANRHVLVISDLTKQTWAESSDTSSTAALLAEEPPVALTVFDLGRFQGTNRALSIPNLSDATPPSGVSVPISVEVGLSETEQQEPVSVTAELKLYEADPTLPVVRNGTVRRPELRSVDRTNVEVAPGQSSELVLDVPPVTTGTHHGMVSLVGDDAFPLDDQRYFSLQVLPPSPLLLVSEQEDEARVIGQTITAPFAVDDPRAEFAVQRIAPGDLPVVRLADFQVVVMLDPPPKALRDPALARFVANGGGVLICLGPSAGQGELKVGPLPPLVRRWRRPEPGTFLEVLRPGHPVFSPLTNLGDEIRWSDYRVWQYWQANVGDTDTVLARYAGTEHPAVIERADGQGRWHIVTTPLPAVAASTRGWNEFFSASDPWPAFILVRRMVERLSERAGVAAMTSVGQPHVIPLPVSESEAASAALAGAPAGGMAEDVTGDDARTATDEVAAGEVEGAAEERWQLFPPGNTSPVPLSVAADQQQVVASDVSVAGTYWLRGESRSTGFSANLSRAATQTERIDPERLDGWFGPDGYTRVTARGEIDLAETGSEQSISLHSPAILLALVVFLLEQVLSNRFYRTPVGTTTPGSLKAA